MLSPNIFLYPSSLPGCLYSLPFSFFLQFPFLKLNDTVLICSPTPPETIELNYIFLIVGEWLGYNYAWKCIT